MWPRSALGRRDGGSVRRARSRSHNAASETRCFLRLVRREEVAMLEQYFVRPATIDRIRGSWIAAEIEAYVAWLVEQGYSTEEHLAPCARSRSPSASSLVGEVPGRSASCRRMWRRSSPSASRPRGADRLEEADGEGGPGPGRADARGRARGFRAHRSTAPRPALCRCRAELLRLPGRGAWPSPGLGAGLSPPPRTLRGLPAADRCRHSPGALAGDPERFRRRPRRRRAGQEHRPRRCRCAAGVPALPCTAKASSPAT